MKNTHLLLSLSTAVLLTACGGGGGGGISATTNPTGSVSELTQNYTVPTNLKSQVAAAKRKIFFEKEPDIESDRMTETLNGKTRVYKPKDILDYNELPLGISSIDGTYDAKTYKQKSKTKVYNMPYSLVMGDTLIEDFNKENNQPFPKDPTNEFSATIVGLRTKTLPTMGRATYTGFAMDKESTGKLSMLVDFSNKAVVSGSLVGLSQGDITFKKGKITPITIEDIYDHPEINAIGFIGEATGVKLSNSQNIAVYAGQFFGSNAEEVNGFVEEIDKKDPSTSFNVIKGAEVQTHAAFGGQRDEIQK